MTPQGTPSSPPASPLGPTPSDRAASTEAVLAPRARLAAVAGLVVLAALIATAIVASSAMRTGSLGEAVDPSNPPLERIHAQVAGKALAAQIPPAAQRVASSSSSHRTIHRVQHTVHTGGTLETVGNVYGIPLADLKKLNPSLDPSRELRPGTKVTVYRKGWRYSDEDTIDRRKEHLRRPVPLWDGPGRRIRRRSRSWGTRPTVLALDRALTAYGEAYPDGPVIIVSDMSRRKGGRLPPHHGHREGRDADLSYVPIPEHDNGGFIKMSKRYFDVDRNWLFYRELLATGHVQTVLMDTKLQKLLYERAKRAGMGKAWLRRVFQYPRDPTSKAGIIRHWDNHDDHVHIRFKG